MTLTRSSTVSLAHVRADAASRIAEILKVIYVAEVRATKRGGSKDATLANSLKALLARLGLDVSDFDPQIISALMEHQKRVCLARPRCGSCPLVSFCDVGKERVKDDRKPIAVDLFGGAGGLGFGFRKAGFRIGLAVEMDRDAAQTYRLNNPGVHVIEADVGSICASDVLNLIGLRPAVICAGPPCQSYSAAGKRATQDPRHHLFRHVLTLARDLKPDAVVIENVPGINRKIGRRSYKEIIECELGKQFAVEVHLLRAVDYGVPQLRKRYFFFGRRRTLAPLGAPPRTHKEKSHAGRLPDSPTVMDVLRGLPRREQGRSKDWARLGDGTVLWNVGTMSHAQRVIKKINEIRGGEGPLSYRRVSRAYANTIIAGHRALPVHPTLHRTLSVREAARIQGFDKDYVFLGARANQPLQVANAVPPPLARAIARHVVLRTKPASSRKAR